jgi:8-oxo-dGTP pyrophosphatase MutT (NUDIX family)
MSAELMAKSDSGRLVGTTLLSLLDQSVLLADVHNGNIGRVERGIVITDPGHMMPLTAKFAETLARSPMPGTGKRLPNPACRHENPVARSGNPNRFWGRAGAGALVLAADTGRVLFAQRSQHVNEPGTWGTWGGSIEENEGPEAAAMREVREETGYRGPAEPLVPLLVFASGNFVYRNYLLIVPEEFMPRLNWESSGAVWLPLEEAPHPRHYGLATLLADPESRRIIDAARAVVNPACRHENPVARGARRTKPRSLPSLEVICDPPRHAYPDEPTFPLGWELIEACSFKYTAERGDVRGEYLHTRSPDDEPSPGEQGEQLLIEQIYARPPGVGLGTEAIRALRARYSTTASGKTQLPTVVLINIETRDGLKLGRRGVEQGLVKVAIDRDDAIIATDADELFGPAEQSRIENPFPRQRRKNPPEPWLFRKRFVYALTRRPASTSTVPKGFVELGPATAEHPFGTVVFERPLPRPDIKSFELEPLDAEDPIVLRRARNIYRDEVYERFSDTSGFEQPDAVGGGRTTLSYSTRAGVEYQVTYWLADWTPTGHLDVDDFDEAVGALWASMSKAERNQRAESAVWRARR